jgi:hypothetical protein
MDIGEELGEEWEMAEKLGGKEERFATTRCME